MRWLARARNRLCAVARAAWRPAYTLRIPEAVLQRRVESWFPLEKTRYGCTLTLRDPAKGRHRLARCFLKSVAVRDRQLRVELGWGGHRDPAG